MTNDETWMPGDRALATVRGVADVEVVRTDNPRFPWRSGEAIPDYFGPQREHTSGMVCNIRPLPCVHLRTKIDLEDAHSTIRMLEAECGHLRDDLAIARASTANAPRVEGQCPACGSSALFLGSGGYVTCSVKPCPNPTAASEAIGVTFP